VQDRGSADEGAHPGPLCEVPLPGREDLVDRSAYICIQGGDVQERLPLLM